MASGDRFDAIFDGQAAAGLGPAELLGRFNARRDQDAFAALVAHHGPMVLATCRRILAHRADADDAFQATFLVLARRADSIADPERLAPWLHGVARRVSARARSAAARRRAVEGPARGEAAAAPAPADADADGAAELRSVLDEELARLPEKYRAPLVLCYLEGLTHDQAAGRLAWPVGTVRSRLAGGRDRLRWRLARRGYAAGDALLPISSVAAPASLVRATVRIAAGAGAIPARVLHLARGVSLAMMWTSQLKALAGAGLLIGLVGGGAVIARPGRGGIPAGGPPVAQDPAPRPASPPPPAVPFPRPLTADYPLTVTGRALDPEGKPIAGARIVLASSSIHDRRRLAEARTDAAGSYTFAAVPLPIRADPGQPARGFFEVFGQADGFGFAWRPAKQLALPEPTGRPPAEVDPPDSYRPGEVVPLDLTFPPPARLAGRIVDDRGQPLVGAAVRVLRCDRPRADRPGAATAFSSFGEVDAMGEHRTDPAGDFAIDGLAPDLWFTISVAPAGFPRRQVIATPMPQPQPTYMGWEVHTGPLDLVFAAPREVAFRVGGGDAGRPAPRVLFGAGQVGGGGGLYSSAVADVEGRGQLELPPGDYRYEILPEYRTPYLVTGGSFAVPAAGPTAPVEATLRPACVLEVAVIDADTGAGLADVDFWAEEPADPGRPTTNLRRLLTIRSYEAATRICHVTRPRTDAAGKLRALIEPGPHRVGVGLESRPPRYDEVDRDGQQVDGKAGETLRLTFPMRRRR